MSLYAMRGIPRKRLRLAECQPDLLAWREAPPDPPSVKLASRTLQRRFGLSRELAATMAQLSGFGGQHE